ncbi:MAG: undecaprenyldiphospho-muramoylpentapeptide beta-N-acetylglucosaminyltransferase [Rhodospirillaceae bacterium]|nr:undecaprenyldiphospho-muramoylpentapeptide beta-N-acetylglucosaminyltransferase [Rhodospirillaceae bacterium]MBT4589493.1 undecaprenyldiphospho-muramoylpentapeptide beta-N-acetylglucosaminyltransferase [Rhodospirillaceae bacterium]MBT7268237.1 undecaprenyldiphospho-muramoylpentapeptide beta-N-acetylglucosaminyltransferase [Rhodospirillaceae bacterium]
MAKPLVVLAAGGTGGHVFPAEALAAELGNRGYRLALVTDRRGGNLKGRLAELETHRVRAGGIAGKGLVARIFSAVEIIIGTLQAWFLLRRLKPAVVVGFGGYASVPTMLAAAYSGTKAAIHEQNAVLGRANRLLASRVEKIATSFEKVLAIPETSKSNVITTGMPVRPQVTLVRDRTYPNLKAEDTINIAVFGGSQGAHIFSTVVPAALRLVDVNLRQRIAVTQQSRAEDVEQVQAAYRDLGVEATISTFFDDVPNRIADAHIVICRSGASTIAELTTIGRPAIFVPYIYAVDDHQTQNAHAVDEVGGGWLIPEGAFTDQVLADRLESLFAIPHMLESAGAAAKAAGKPDAASRLADMVIGMMPNTSDQREAA